MRLLLAVLAIVGTACDAGPRSAGHDSSSDSATLVLQTSIGEDEHQLADNQFSAIAAMLVTSDEKLWVADGFNSATPQVRIYDADGRFLRRVGNVGSGPGEYLNPNRLALLPDGRVVLRDQNIRDRITVYKPDGTVDTTWAVAVDRPYFPGPKAMVVDTSGLVWISISTRPVPVPVFAYLRLRNGEIVDTVKRPPFPDPPRDEIRIERRLPGGGLSVRGAAPPYQPH